MKKRESTMVIVCLVSFVIFFVFQSNLSSIPRLHVTKSIGSQEGKRWQQKTMSKRDPLPPPPQQSPLANISCDRSHHRYDICSISGPTVLDPTISTFFVVGPTGSPIPPPHLVEKVRPYPRKWENFTMSGIKELTLTSGPPSPPCEVQHKAPALVFSAGGYTGNYFHDFNDGLIPLFITVNSIFPDNQDFVLVIAKSRGWWLSKYGDLLNAFSKHPIINLDNDTAKHCFPSATLGLISHGFMTIDPTLLPYSRTFTHFRALLERAYGRKVQNHPSMISTPKIRPRLVLASRSGSGGRVILNQAEAKQTAEEEGFDVFIFEPTSTTHLRNAYALINSSHAMVGVHGAALTHSLFLRPGSVFMQVVPIGTDWVSEACFGKSARDLGLEYMAYKIGVEESSLVQKYGKDDMLLKDPIGLQRKGWSSEIMDIYLKKQNVKLDLVRFRGYLKKAYKKAKKFMDKEG